jgi:hypothetical protein
MLFTKKKLIANKRTESVFINCNTLTPTRLDPARSSSGRTFCCRYTKVALYSWARMCCWLRTALYCICAVQAGTAESSRLQKQRSTQSTAHSRWTIKCYLRVTTTESSPWRTPSRVETCRSECVTIDEKNSLCICWWLMFFVYYSARTWNTLKDRCFLILVLATFGNEKWTPILPPVPYVTDTQNKQWRHVDINLMIFCSFIFFWCLLSILRTCRMFALLIVVKDIGRHMQLIC